MTARRRPRSRHDDSRSRRLLLLAGIAGFAVIVLTFWLWWPLGVALGLLAGTSAVLSIGLVMHSAAHSDSSDHITARTQEQLIAS